MKRSSSGDTGLNSEAQDPLHSVVRAALGSDAALASAPGIDEARERLSARIAEEGRHERKEKKDKTGAFGLLRINRDGGSPHRQTVFGQQLLRWTAISAGAACVLVACLLLLRPWHPMPTGNTQTYATRSGQQAIITLDDGTRFTLSPNTTLHLLTFHAGARVVALDGEAYVNVAHASGAPFVLQEGNIAVRVLGTEFLIRHALGTPDVRVAVAQGRVRLTTNTRGSSGVTLNAGQIGEAHDSTIHVSTIDDLAPGTEWVDGQMRFRHVQLSEILATMSRWYGYRFRCGDSLFAQQKVTLAISTNSSSEALSEIEQVLHVSLQVKDDTVTLVPQSPRSVNGTPRVKMYDIWTPTREVGR